MSRKKILWLCSWYPGKTEPFNGDFIQRHAQAAALYNDIHVIHVTGDATGVIKVDKEEQFNQSTHLTEQIIYFRKSSSLAGKIIANYRLIQCYKNAVKKYISANGKPDLVHVQVPMKAGIVAVWMKRKFAVPFVVTEHWGIYNEIEELNYSRRTGLFKQATQSIFLNAEKFISVSRYLAEGVNRLVVKKEYTVVPNAVDTEKFYCKEVQNGRFRFIHVSNMVRLKNAEGIIRAFQELQKSNNQVELIMVGDANPVIREYAKELGLTEEVISFRGEISYDRVAVEMQQSHCLVLFSDIENSPCVIGEALCCGLPVIVTNAGGIPELVEENNAILVAPRNENELLIAMQQMITEYKKFDRNKIAANAKNKFSYPVIGKKISEVYELVSPATR